MKKIIAVVGPTASGKTALGVNIAEYVDGEVISADSMQIYEEMNIATAKPTPEEMHQIPHHLIGFVSPTDSYSVATFCEDAEQAAEFIYRKKKMPVLVGGTGLYVDSFLNNISFLEDGSCNKVRNDLKARLLSEGIEALYRELCEIDCEAASKIHPNNEVKVLRALEVYYATGKTISEQVALSKAVPSSFNPLYIGIDYKDRDILYNRINKRVDIMMQNGLLEETKLFYEKKKSDTSVNAIGYKELKPFLDGENTLEQCVENLKKATRHYAKRQLTWFRRNENIHWFYPDEYACVEAMYEGMYQLIDDYRKDEMQ